MTDATGLAQFLRAIGEIARGASSPSILPVWERELLHYIPSSTKPYSIHSQQILHLANTTESSNQHINKYGPAMARRSFFFGPSEMSAIRRFTSSDNKYTTFELLTACYWRCCALAFELDPNEEATVVMAVSVRTKLYPALPVGYYGNAYVNTLASETAGKVCQENLEHVLGLIKSAKGKVNEEYVQSLVDLSRARGQEYLHKIQNGYRVSDISKVGFEEADFGWGEAEYAGNCQAWHLDGPAVQSLYVRVRNKYGQDGIIMLVALPAPVMEKFATALENMIKNNNQSDDSPRTPT